jgi:dTDP-D-glucose 4,6-dehydratase
VANEEALIEASPLDPSDLYNISKLMGESVALCSGRKARVARISNVFGGDLGSGNFLSSIIGDAVTKGKIVLHSSPDSEKDYIGINDVVEGLIQIVRGGRHAVYNVASGSNVSNRALVDQIGRLTNCEVEWLPGAPRLAFPSICIERMQVEFGFAPLDVLGELDGLVSLYKDSIGNNT